MIELANSVYPDGGGLPIRLEHENVDTLELVYVVTFPVRSVDFFSNGRPQVQVNLTTGTAERLPQNSGRERPVEFTDVELDEDWWRNLPN